MKQRFLGLLVMLVLVLACPGLALAFAPGNQDALIRDTIKKLNSDKSVVGTDDIKSYKILFNAYLELTKPPQTVGSAFNLNTIHPKMSNWSAVSGWAESNPKMAEAILSCRDKVIIGLPYGRE